LGVEFKNDKFYTPIYNKATNESSAFNVYIAGVVCGGLITNKWFIENSSVHAELIITDLARKLS